MGRSMVTSKCRGVELVVVDDVDAQVAHRPYLHPGVRADRDGLRAASAAAAAGGCRSSVGAPRCCGSSVTRRWRPSTGPLGAGVSPLDQAVAVRGMTTLNAPAPVRASATCAPCLGFSAEGWLSLKGGMTYAMCRCSHCRLRPLFICRRPVLRGDVRRAAHADVEGSTQCARSPLEVSPPATVFSFAAGLAGLAPRVSQASSRWPTCARAAVRGDDHYLVATLFPRRGARADLIRAHAAGAPQTRAPIFTFPRSRSGGLWVLVPAALTRRCPTSARRSPCRPPPTKQGPPATPWTSCRRRGRRAFSSCCSQASSPSWRSSRWRSRSSASPFGRADAPPASACCRAGRPAASTTSSSRLRLRLPRRDAQ